MVCWFQGESEMPPLVKGCFVSIKSHVSKHPVILITKENYAKYISIQDYIIKKLRDGKISYTHFSDIIRNYLLADHGGVLLDATILLTDELRSEHLPFFTLKMNAPKEFRLFYNCMNDNKSITIKKVLYVKDVFFCRSKTPIRS